MMLENPALPVFKKKAKPTNPQPESCPMQPSTLPRGIRYRSTRHAFGLPLVSVAIGPDPDQGEWHGHARGLLAIGDVATGWIALGGLARGGLALGGLALGGIAIGGLAIGVVSVGGLALGALALGGAAGGLVAIGGASVGYYALGGAAQGVAVISAMQQDSAAVDFFSSWAPFLPLP